MFSIIIPLYNKAPYIEKAIRSVFSQTYQEFELIVIDDGSTDIYKPPNPPKGGLEITCSDIDLLLGEQGFIKRQENQGVSMARNNGVALAQYPYIAFLDADDWWAPTFLEEMKNLIEEFPDAGIYGSSYYYVKNKENKPAQIGVDKDFERGYINYCQVYAKTLWMPLTSISVVLPKNIFEAEQGFNPQLKLGEDFDLWIRIAMKHPVVCLNKALAYYNQDADITFRAIGRKFYQPEEHMLFTDYGNWMQNEDFRFLFERLALYGLLPYYLNQKNKDEVNNVLKDIRWEKHERKYWWYYKGLPKWGVRSFFELKRVGAYFKSKIKKLRVTS